MSKKRKFPNCPTEEEALAKQGSNSRNTRFLVPCTICGGQDEDCPHCGLLGMQMVTQYEYKQIKLGRKLVKAERCIHYVPTLWPPNDPDYS